MTAAERLVLDFCAAWTRRDTSELLGFLADDAVYHNMPMQPVQGHAAIKGVFDFFLTPAESAAFEVRHSASAGDLVFTERIDRFRMGGREIALPVAGVFEVRDGKITAWRDYFDMAAWNAQSAQSAG